LEIFASWGESWRDLRQDRVEDFSRREFREFQENKYSGGDCDRGVISTITLILQGCSKLLLATVDFKILKYKIYSCSTEHRYEGTSNWTIATLDSKDVLGGYMFRL